MNEKRGYVEYLARIAVLAAVFLIISACGGGHEVGEVTRPTAPSTEGMVASPTATVAPLLEASLICAEPFDEEVPGIVGSAELNEISGLVASRSNPGVLWVHNDSGDSPRVFAMTSEGEDLGSYNLVGADAVDWEDMAIGPGPVPATDYLYLADIGDNPRERSEVAIYRVPEPAVAGGEAAVTHDLTGVERLTLRYPDRAHDSETLLVDPISGDLFLVTKEVAGGDAFVFRAPASWEVAGTATLEHVGEIDFIGLESGLDFPEDAPPLVRGAGFLPTAGDVSPDGGAIAIRTYSTVWVWARAAGSELAEAFSSEPCEGPSASEAQGEAIGFDPDGTGYFTVSEGTNPPLYHFSHSQ